MLAVGFPGVSDSEIPNPDKNMAIEAVISLRYPKSARERQENSLELK